MLSKSTLFTSVVSVASIVSAQSGESAASVSAAVSSAVAVLNFVDGFASALSAEPVAQVCPMSRQSVCSILSSISDEF